jgi:glucose/mannose-6-phosphate isomerase
MRNLLSSFPVQFEAAIELAAGISLEVPSGINNVVVSGMGGSAIGGDVVRAALGKTMRIPMLVNRDYGLPSFADASSLIFACSYSGNTEETLSAYRDALSSNANVVCITSGGELSDRAESDGFPWIKIPSGLPPRAALGYSSVVLLGALQALRLIPDMSEALRETHRLLVDLADRYAPEIPEHENEAKLLARLLHGKVVAVYASSGILGAAAVRWRGQIEENAKTLAFHHVLPEMNHNELVGWENPERVLKHVGVVLLRDREDHPQVQRRFEFTRDLVKDKAGMVQEAWTQGNSLLARIFSVIYFGDFLSLYLAYLNSADPTPVSVIDRLKLKLSLPQP